MGNKKWGVRNVTITRPFYVGVFEITQAQWKLLMGDGEPNFHGNPEVDSVRSMDGTPFCRWRGEKSPRQPSPDSFVGRLHSRTGVREFDLPTEARWEYACRAGTETDFYNNKNLKELPGRAPERCEALEEIARYCGNSHPRHENWDPLVNCPYNRGPWECCAPVGVYVPNRWGLYDMLGNVEEFCIDSRKIDEMPESDITDPVGTHDEVVKCGGSWCSEAEYCTSWYPCSRTRWLSNYEQFVGARIVCNASLLADVPSIEEFEAENLEMLVALTAHKANLEAIGEICDGSRLLGIFGQRFGAVADTRGHPRQRIGGALVYAFAYGEFFRAQDYCVLVSPNEHKISGIVAGRKCDSEYAAICECQTLKGCLKNASTNNLLNMIKDGSCGSSRMTGAVKLFA